MPDDVRARTVAAPKALGASKARCHLVIVLQPWVQERNVLPFADSMAWRPELGTKILVIDKADLIQYRIVNDRRCRLGFGE